MRDKEKSKSLPLLEYYELVQLEYIQAELRADIYPEKQAKYWNKLITYKKEIIDSISSKHGFSSIFNTESYKEDFCNKFYPAYRIPNFIYRKNEENTKLYDFINYYKKGETAKGIKQGIEMIGTIKMTNTVDRTICVDCIGNRDLMLFTEFELEVF